MSRNNRRGVAPRAARELLKVTNRAKTPESERSWYRIGNTFRNATTQTEAAEVWIYDEIGFWGVTASDFARDLADLDVDEITLRLNSPGGEVYDGIAIMNALMDHKAKVTVKVDALAASIASVIAMSGDEVVMGPHSEFMIHDASTIGIGNSADLREVADMLDRISNNIAEVYSERAGGTPKEWRDRMLAETWFTASEAVAAGLADKVASKPPAREQGQEDEDEPMDAHRRRTLNRFDLSGFKYRGRVEAPQPILDAKKAEENPAPAPEEPDEEDDGEDGVVDCDHVDYREDCEACKKDKQDSFEDDGEVEGVVDFGALFASAMAEAVEYETPLDPEIFHHAIKGVTDAAIPAPPRVVALPEAPAPLFPADSGEPVPPPADPEFAGYDPAVFRAALELAANNAPAVTIEPETRTAPEIPEFVIDKNEFYNSLREAI